MKVSGQLHVPYENVDIN